MTVKLSPVFQEATLDSSGNPYVGAQLFTFSAGSTTKQTTYQDSAGSTPHTNPIILNSRGEPPAPIWLASGLMYKFVLATPTDSDPPAGAVRTIDNVSGVNDTSVSIDQWSDSGLTPTYISGSSFSVSGDQTTALHIGRRLKITDAGGTKYASITVSVFTTLTTVTVSVDAGGSLSSPVSAVALAILTSTNPSIPDVIPGNKTFTGAIRLDADISPSQLTGNVDNWAPAGFSGASAIRFSTDARRNITGLTAGAEGRILTLHNVGAFPACFKYQDGSSTDVNRFAFGQTLGGGQSMMVQYDATTQRWRLLFAPPEIGSIKDFGGSTIEEGYLAIDQDVSRTTYAVLFNILGTTWGAGDGVNTFGLYLGKGAGLIAAGTGTQTASGVDADVDLTGNTLAVAANTDKWITGMAVVFNLTSGTITGLVDDTTYYVIRGSSSLIGLASSLANAQIGVGIDFTAKSSPVWDITHTYTTRTHGERVGAEVHAMSNTELLAHTHIYADLNAVGGNVTPGAGAGFGSAATGSSGGNAAMNIMNPSTVVTRGIRYA